MTEELERLWRLHDLDERAATVKAALAKYPEQKSSLEGRVNTEKKRLEVHAVAADEALKARRKVEQEIETVNAQQKEFEKRQPQVKTNEEFRALTAEIDGCKRKRSDLETKVLESMDREEALASQKPAIERALKEAEAERNGRIAEIARAEDTERAQLAELEAQRQEQIAGLPQATRLRYERIHGARDGRAVVAVINNACGGCYRAQPPQLMQDIRRGDRVITCDGCGRILVQPPGDPVSPA
jgi:predicted  nucleic acid-binding Zn-ribbon protein